MPGRHALVLQHVLECVRVPALRQHDAFAALARMHAHGLVEAGGDLACIGASSYVQPVLDGLNANAAGDATFARKVQQSAIRVMTLKYEMGLAR